VLSLPIVVIGLLIAAVVALIAIFLTDFMGIRSAVVNAIGGVLDALGGLVADLGQWAAGIANSAVQWGKDLMQGMADGILAAATAPIDAAKGVIDGVTDKIGFDERENDRMAERWGSDMMTRFGMGIEQGMAEEVPNNILNTDTGGGAGSVGETERIHVNVSGRDVDKQTRRFNDKRINRRGRYS
jgi:hypothetical protein